MCVAVERLQPLFRSLMTPDCEDSAPEVGRRHRRSGRGDVRDASAMRRLPGERVDARTSDTFGRTRAQRDVARGRLRLRELHAPLGFEVAVDESLRGRADVAQMGVLDVRKEDVANLGSLVGIRAELRLREKRVKYTEVGVAELGRRRSVT